MKQKVIGLTGALIVGGFVLLLAGTLPSKTDAKASVAAACPTVKVIGVRGTNDGKKSRVGKYVGAFVRELKKRVKPQVSGRSFQNVAVRYPAVAVPYGASVRRGVSKVKMLLAKCQAKTLYVLAGYSQGAHVIGDAIQNGHANKAKPRVVATVFFGDPKYDPKMKGVEFRGATKKGGALGGRTNKKAFVGYKVLSYCRASDPWCQGNWSNILRKKFKGHERYHRKEASAAAKIVAVRLRSRLKDSVNLKKRSCEPVEFDESWAKAKVASKGVPCEIARTVINTHYLKLVNKDPWDGMNSHGVYWVIRGFTCNIALGASQAVCRDGRKLILGSLREIDNPYEWLGDD